MATPSYILLYDGDCSLCKNLALLIQKRHQQAFNAQSLQSYRAASGKIDNSKDKSHGDIRLQVIDGEQVYHDERAWQFLLQTLPELRSLQWLAQKLNLESAAVKALKWSAHAARRLCLRCR